MNESELKKIIATNITEYRKLLNLTQFELAQKISYSDKSVSKWERAEAIPDVIILKRLADLFGVTIDNLITESPDKKHTLPQSTEKSINKKRAVISALIIVSVFFIATLVYCLLAMFSVREAWICFIFAIPVSAIILIIFSSIWKRSVITTGAISLLSWSIALLLFIFIDTKSYLFFILAAAFQVIIFFWHILKIKHREK